MTKTNQDDITSSFSWINLDGVSEVETHTEALKLAGHCLCLHSVISIGKPT